MRDERTIYRGLRDGAGCIVTLQEPGAPRPLQLDPRYDLRNHSPTGFEWGYGGSGPAQLALALVADATGDDLCAQRTYQRFKFEIVGGLPRGGWELEAGEIAKFARLLDTAHIEG